MCKTGCWGYTDLRQIPQLCHILSVTWTYGSPSPRLFPLCDACDIASLMCRLCVGWDVKKNRCRILCPVTSMVNAFNSQACKSLVHPLTLRLEHARLGADYLSLPHTHVRLSAPPCPHPPTIHSPIHPPTHLSMSSTVFFSLLRQGFSV